MRGRWSWSPPLRWRVFALLTALAGLLLLDAVLGATYNSQLQAEQQVVSRLRPLEEHPETLVTGLIEQQKSVRGFALTGDERLLRLYRERQEFEGSTITRLQRGLRGQPRMLALVEAAAAGAQRWHVRVAERVISLTEAGRTDRAARLIVNRDEPLFAALRRDAVALSREIDDRLDVRQGRALAAGDTLNRWLLTSSLLGLLVLLVSGALLRRWLTRPIIDLSEQVRRVAHGRLGHRIVGTGPTELRSLGDDVESMRRRIIEELEESRRAIEGLQQNAPLVMSLRSELVTPEVSIPTGLRLAARFEPAEGVLAGDWMDTIRLDENRIGVIVVDVSGHGPEAGLRALWLKHLLVPAMNLELDPGDALHWAAGQVGDTGEWFATCMIFEINAATGRCQYANAGHPPGLVLGRGGLRQLAPTGPLFTDLPGARWKTAQTTLAEDELLVVYTDGITEARDGDGEEFGEERLAAALTAAASLDVDVVADQVMERVHTFAGRLVDDATLVLATRPRVHVGAGAGTTSQGRDEARR
ncbi:MAG: SpoIIE family protein phosphatase [Actinomycetota bacterium]|nr:SpoIIE family protein phosphatase [Actinomycetota bacterium]